MVSQIFSQAYLLDLVKIPGDHETLSILRHVRLHVDFSSMIFWAFRPSPLCV